jgi:uncharacterized protein with PIN domain
MKFLADVMLGRLTTWLRLLGYDTTFFSDADDPTLAQLARDENRILLTRDVELTRRRGLKFLLIESDQVEDQVRQVFRALNLSLQEAFSRCAECNVLLQDMDKESVQGRVPPYVFQTQERYRQCPHCQRIYWRGTHWARMLARIQDLSESEIEA